MLTTENNVAAQAGDESMQKAFEAYFSDEGQSPKAIEKTFDGQYRLAQAASAWRTWQACWPVAQVSPRATADVERDVILEEAARLCDAIASDWSERREYEKVFASEYVAERIRELKSAATTKPGA